MLSEAGKHYGEGIIKEYSLRLTEELGKGSTQSRLRYFRRFYIVFSKCPTLSDKLTYSHYVKLFGMMKKKMNYYIETTEKNILSVRNYEIESNLMNMKDYQIKQN